MTAASLRYRVTGHGTPVLLLHGIGRSLDDWDEQHALLSADHEVWSMDMPGFGQSPAPSAGVRLQPIAGDIAAFLGEKDLGAVHVVGNSLGGGAALQLAADHPELVRSLLLVDPVGFGRSASILLRLASIPGIGELLLAPSIRVTRRLEQAIYHDSSIATKERIQGSHQLRLRPGARATFLQAVRSLGAPWGVKSRWRKILLARVSRTGTPTMVVWGEADRIFPASHLHAAERLLGAQTHLFPETGHAPQIERPVEFAQTALTFWQKRETAT